MIRKFFAALGCAVLGAAVMLLALPLLLIAAAFYLLKSCA